LGNSDARGIVPARANVVGSAKLPRLEAPVTQTAKRIWAEPVLIVFGTVDQITLGRNKNFGSGDAFTFQNQTTRLSS
jgi:hypothetical protein